MIKATEKNKLEIIQRVQELTMNFDKDVDDVDIALAEFYISNLKAIKDELDRGEAKHG